MEYTISNDALTLVAGTQGAELHSLTTRDGLDLLWNADPAVWNRHAPVCFPWCGAVEEGWYEVEGVRYKAAQRHGFVRDQDHALVEQGPDRMTFTLDWPGDTEMWPWAFGFETVHTLEGDAAVTACTAENKSGKPMPVQLGFHPALRCPFLPGTELEEYQFHFESGKVIPLEPHLFDNDSIRYTGVGAWVRLEHAATGKYLEVDTADFPNVLLWSKPGVPGFVCIEPWCGYPGPEHDLAARFGAYVMAPGEKRTWKQIIRVCL